MNNNNKSIHMHNFKSTIIHPTCKEIGYTLHKCDCGYEHKDNFTPIGNHSYILTKQKLSTCIDNGTNEWCCSVCGESITENFAPL